MIKFFEDYTEIEIPWEFGEDQIPGVGDIITAKDLGKFEVTKILTTWITPNEKLVEVILTRLGNTKKKDYFRIP